MSASAFTFNFESADSWLGHENFQPSTSLEVIHTYVLQVYLALYIIDISSVCGDNPHTGFRRNNNVCYSQRKLTATIDCKHGARSLKTK